MSGEVPKLELLSDKEENRRLRFSRFMSPFGLMNLYDL